MGCLRLDILEQDYKSCEQKMFAVKNNLTLIKSEKKERSKYFYGMNTQEKDDEIFVGAMGAKFWEYDSRIGRRWNVEPVIDESLSPYATFENNPILFDDPDGDCPWCFALALLEGGAELGGQLLAGKSLDEVDWADVGIATAEGFVDGIPGAGVIVGTLKTTLKIVAPIAKATFDYSTSKGNENVFNGKKSVTHAAIELGSDVIVGKVFDKIGSKSVNPLVKKYLKQTIIKKTTEDAILKTMLKKSIRPHATSKQIARTEIQKKVANKAAQQLNTAKILNSQVAKGTVKSVENKIDNQIADKVKTAFPNTSKKDMAKPSSKSTPADKTEVKKEQHERGPIEQAPRF